MTEINVLMPQLEEKDTPVAYKALQELEFISDSSGLLYPYTDKFVSMIVSDEYVKRVRGFRLFCKQAKWDVDYKLDENLDEALHILNDAKPTAVRQALAALHDVIKYKPELRDSIYRAVSKINYMKYKDTMHSLIKKDIQKLLNVVGE